MGHVFISYSHKDTKYAHRLAESLQNMGMDIWIDERLDYGSQWPLEIQKQLDSCNAFILVMSPRSFESDWVQSELQRAKRKLKPIFPLLLEGDEPWLSVESTQYYDVRNEDLPDDKFYSILRRVVSRSQDDKTDSALSNSSRTPRLRIPRPRNLVLVAGAVIILLIIFLLISNSGILSLLAIGATPTSTRLPIETNSFPATIDSKGAEMVLIPANSFTMGSELDNSMAECKKYRSDCQQRWFEDEFPSRVIYLDAFYVDKYEITNALYQACVQANGCKPPLYTNSSTRTSYYQDPQFSNYPVIYVNWDMANAYCKWRGGHLPTEAQWEKAARGTNGNTYPWGNDFKGNNSNFCDVNCDSKNHFDDGYKDTAPVDSYPNGTSPYGIYNVSGNVWEWVADWYAVYPGGDPNGSDYFEPAQAYRVIRGGSWNSNVDLLRTSNRDPKEPMKADNNIGFRCVQDVTQ